MGIDWDNVLTEAVDTALFNSAPTCATVSLPLIPAGAVISHAMGYNASIGLAAGVLAAGALTTCCAVFSGLKGGYDEIMIQKEAAKRKTRVIKTQNTLEIN